MTKPTHGLFGVALAIGLFALAMPASASRTISTDDISSPPPHPYTTVGVGCLFGQSCGFFNMGFSINTGSGSSHRLYAYDDGVISLGKPVAAANQGAGAIDGFGVPVLVSGLINPDMNGSYRVVESVDGGADWFQVNYLEFPQWGGGAYNFNSVRLSIDSSSVVTVKFHYEDAYSDNPEFYLSGFTYGYKVNDTSWSGIFGWNWDGDVNNRDIEFSFQSLPATSETPEPSAWLSMIAGFGLLGAALRRGRHAAIA
jgi:hypothetical protein